MIKKFLQYFIVVVSLSQSFLLAEDDLVFHSIQDVTSYGLQHNTQLNAQKLQWEASKALPKKLGSLPDPMIGLRLNGSPAKNDTYSFDQKRYVASQSFPFFGELSHLKNLGSSKEKEFYLDYLLAQNKLANSIETTVFKIMLNQELKAIAEKNKESLKQLSNIADVKYRSGLGIQANVLKAQVSLGKVDEELLSLRHEETAFLEQLKQLLSVNSSLTLNLDLNKLKYDPDITIKDSWLTKSLAIQRKEALQHNKELALQTEKDRYRPNFSTQIEVWDNSTADNQYAGHIMMSVPWFNSKNKAAVTEAGNKYEASTQLVQDTENQIRSHLITLVSDINTTAEKINLYENRLLNDATLSLSNFQQSYEVGKASFIDYFESEQTLFNLEKKQAYLKFHYNKQLSALKWQFEKGVIPHE